MGTLIQRDTNLVRGTQRTMAGRHSLGLWGGEALALSPAFTRDEEHVERTVSTAPAPGDATWTVRSSC